MSDSIRFAVPGDAEAILAIYAPYVEGTMISLEAAPPSLGEFAGRVRRILASFPYLVYVRDGKIIGYAYADRFHEREGYRYDVSVSIYLSPEAQGRGVGKSLYSRLLVLLREQGFCNAYAIISVPNEKSVGLHRHFGFADIGVLPGSGYKFGRWCDVAYMGLDLGAPRNPPGEIRGMGELPADFVRRTLQL